jgi:arylformamidase
MMPRHPTTVCRPMVSRWLVICALAVGIVAGALVAAPAQAARTKPIEVAYGSDARQRIDVYLPEQRGSAPAPIIVMVHGGAWVVGNKSLPYVVDNKIARWSPRGAIFVSVGYRLVPMVGTRDVTPLDQADDVARAIAKVQALAPSWGGDPQRLVLMGHSAGAHLVALISASDTFARRAGAQPWRGTVVLDSAGLNLVGVMTLPHPRLYDRAFGSDPALWRAASPLDTFGAGALPMLVVCSTQRADRSCLQSSRFAAHAVEHGVRASVLEQDLSHGEVNAKLGLPGAYTDAVEAFFASVGVELR